MNESIKNAIWVALAEFQNKNINKTAHLHKLRFYRQRDFEDIQKSDIPYIEDFIPYVADEEARKYLQEKIS